MDGDEEKMMEECAAWWRAGAGLYKEGANFTCGGLHACPNPPVSLLLQGKVSRAELRTRMEAAAARAFGNNLPPLELGGSGATATCPRQAAPL